MMRIESFTKGAEKGKNEDGVVSSSSLFLVIDGATGLNDQPRFSPSDAAWLRERLEKELPAALKGKVNIARSLEGLSGKLRGEFMNDGEPLEKWEFPSAGLIGFRIERRKIRLFSLGDLEALVLFENGTTFRFKDNRLGVLDDNSIKALTRELEDGKGVEEAKKAIKPLLRKNRELINEKGGYSAFSLERKPAFAVKECLLPLRDVKSIILMSDGFYAARDVYKAYSSRGLLSERNSLKAIYSKIAEASSKDPFLKAYPRLKALDDATALRVRLKK